MMCMYTYLIIAIYILFPIHHFNPYKSLTRNKCTRDIILALQIILRIMLLKNWCTHISIQWTMTTLKRSTLKNIRQPFGVGVVDLWGLLFDLA